MAEPKQPSQPPSPSPAVPESDKAAERMSQNEITTVLNASYRSSDDVPGDWSRLLSRLL